MNDQPESTVIFCKPSDVDEVADELRYRGFIWLPAGDMEQSDSETPYLIGVSSRNRCCRRGLDVAT